MAALSILHSSVHIQRNRSFASSSWRSARLDSALTGTLQAIAEVRMYTAIALQAFSTVSGMHRRLTRRDAIIGKMLPLGRSLRLEGLELVPSRKKASDLMSITSQLADSFEIHTFCKIQRL